MSRTPVGALGVLAVASVLAWTVGPLGLAAGALIAVAWWLLPPVPAVAVGHVIALPVVPAGPEPTVLAALEAGFLGVLAGPLLGGPRRWLPFAVLVLGGAGLGAAAWFGWHAWQPRWLAGGLLVSVVAIGGYGLHRYAVVSLDRRGVTR